MKPFYVFIIFIALVGCKRPSSYNLDKIPDNGLLLTKWQVLGPFESKGNTNYFEVDNLSQFGFNETTVTYNDFRKIEIGKENRTKNQFVDSLDYKLDFNRLFGYNDSTTVKGNVYCACILKSGENRKLKLNFSSDDGSKVWLNHRLIYSLDRVNGLKGYDNYIDLDLKKGNNFLLVKVNNKKSRWEMFASVEEANKESSKRVNWVFYLGFGHYFLETSFIKHDSLVLNKNMPKGEYTILVNDIPDSKVIAKFNKNDKYAWDISNLKDGFYCVKIITPNDTFQESFYKGDILTTIQQLFKKLDILASNEVYKRNILALRHRFNHLLKPENLGKDDDEKREWEKKLLLIYKNLSFYYNDVNGRTGKINSPTGGFIRTFVSKIDGGTQYYQLFVPKNYNPMHPLPLIIEMPKFMKWHPSPLETYRFANIKLFEIFEDLSNRYNVIILDPCCRTMDMPNMNTIDEADFWENIADVKKFYNTDTTRIYLRGACLSARSALKLAVKYPDKFAAISTTSPELKISNIENTWLQQNEPTNYFMNIKTMPFLNIHSVLDTHTPIKESEKLNELAYKIGLQKFTYRKLFREFKEYYSEEYLDDIYSFITKYSINYSPNEITFSTSQLKYNKSFWITLNEINSGQNAFLHAKIENNVIKIDKRNVLNYTIDLNTLPYKRGNSLKIIDNDGKVFDGIPKGQLITIPKINLSVSLTKNKVIEGPLAHIFEQPFIIATGTSGSVAECIKTITLSDTINKYWAIRYFTKCKTKPDQSIKENDMLVNNILLLGLPEPNSILGRAVSKLPLKITKSDILIGKYSAKGENLGFYVVYPNPINPKKYIAIIGYNTPSFISLGFEDDRKTKIFNDISNYGWFDYKIWDAKTSKTIVAGYFDFTWK